MSDRYTMLEQSFKSRCMDLENKCAMLSSEIERLKLLLKNK